jgi:type II secretory pathway pseudopilin PulG
VSVERGRWCQLRQGPLCSPRASCARSLCTRAQVRCCAATAAACASSIAAAAAAARRALTSATRRARSRRSAAAARAAALAAARSARTTSRSRRAASASWVQPPSDQQRSGMHARGTFLAGGRVCHTQRDQPDRSASQISPESESEYAGGLTGSPHSHITAVITHLLADGSSLRHCSLPHGRRLGATG